MTTQQGAGLPRDDEETGVAAGVPGPSGTGETTDAGADPAAAAGVEEGEQ